MELERSLYYLWLVGIRGIGPVTQRVLLDTFKTPEAVYHASEEELRASGIAANRCKLVLEARDLDGARQELEQCRKLGVFLVMNQDEIYPKKLRRIADMPVLLYGRGKPELFRPDADLGIDLSRKWQPFGPDYVPTELDWWWKDEPLINCPNRRIAVVGVGHCTREDKEKCIARVARCGEDNPGAIIISGGAKGVDGYAHTAAIENGLRTIAFVAFLKDKAIEFAKKKLSITYLVTESEAGELLGYFMLAQFGMNFNVEIERRVSGAEPMDCVDEVLKRIEHQIGGAVVYLDCEDKENLIEFYENIAGYKQISERISKRDQVKYLQFYKFI